ncbi:hypothetical protein [Candidatus Enterococcus mansonii]|uniref:Uncharacterized protein n=1 Tax=Candidatus Enterococcus mansonii TaxID=1834181 RepID=A0ABU8IG65_9ENTE
MFIFVFFGAVLFMFVTFFILLFLVTFLYVDDLEMSAIIFFNEIRIAFFVSKKKEF